MSETKFTPGPWAPEKAGYFINEDDGATVAEVFWDTRTGTRQQQYLEADANAHLIASAPELYEALDDLWEWVRNWSPEFMDDDEFDRSIYESALAKARGES